MVRYEWVIVLAMWCGVMPWMLDGRRRQADIPGFDQYVLIYGTVILCVTFAYLSALGVGIQGGLYVYREHLEMRDRDIYGTARQIVSVLGLHGQPIAADIPLLLMWPLVVAFAHYGYRWNGVPVHGHLRFLSIAVIVWMAAAAYACCVVAIVVRGHYLIRRELPDDLGSWVFLALSVMKWIVPVSIILIVGKLYLTRRRLASKSGSDGGGSVSGPTEGGSKRSGV